MSYPGVSRRNATKMVAELKRLRSSGENIEVLEGFEEMYVELRPGPEYDRQAVDRAGVRMREELPQGFEPGKSQNRSPEIRSSRINLEAVLAGPMHSALGELEVEILQDGDFWRYLALFPFRWYLLAREPELQPQDYGGLGEKKIDGEVVGHFKTNMKYQLLLRTYLWGKCAFDELDLAGTPGETYRRATLLKVDGLSTIDVWHSHIIRIQMGQLGKIPVSFVDACAETPVSTNEARELEKLITRIKHTVLMDVYNYDEARALVDSQIAAAKSRAEIKSS